MRLVVVLLAVVLVIVVVAAVPGVSLAHSIAVSRCLGGNNQGVQTADCIQRQFQLNTYWICSRSCIDRYTLVGYNAVCFETPDGSDLVSSNGGGTPYCRPPGTGEPFFYENQLAIVIGIV